MKKGYVCVGGGIAVELGGRIRSSAIGDHCAAMAPSTN